MQAGDTLERIAQRYYGAPHRWPSIYAANAEVLSLGQPLRVGMEIVVPDN